MARVRGSRTLECQQKALARDPLPTPGLWALGSGQGICRVGAQAGGVAALTRRFSPARGHRGPTWRVLVLSPLLHKHILEPRLPRPPHPHVHEHPLPFAS